ncbi:MAG: hypothetical protein ACHQT9_04260 [Candidatus Saccharimonadales bacterium]
MSKTNNENPQDHNAEPTTEEIEARQSVAGHAGPLATGAEAVSPPARDSISDPGELPDEPRPEPHPIVREQ